MKGLNTRTLRMKNAHREKRRAGSSCGPQISGARGRIGRSILFIRVCCSICHAHTSSGLRGKFNTLRGRSRMKNCVQRSPNGIAISTGVARGHEPSCAETVRRSAEQNNSADPTSLTSLASCGCPMRFASMSQKSKRERKDESSSANLWGAASPSVQLAYRKDLHSRAKQGKRAHAVDTRGGFFSERERRRAGHIS